MSHLKKKACKVRFHPYKQINCYLPICVGKQKCTLYIVSHSGLLLFKKGPMSSKLNITRSNNIHMSNVHSSTACIADPTTSIKKGRGFHHTLLITAFGLHLTPPSGIVLWL